ncbi:hypothetical protein PSHT_08182 [Puccinia striiformis]|uniref:isopentenyl-diphosphate Delta-isomerase n=1 Tax=Puccinia striiformis TaxID=27350 RepID=A0A2S4VRE7_9BASI|nr:hypothetical protein PSHT_08182 [Puccinia striiformis]
MGSISTITDELHGHDQEQIALMEERLILLDRDDNAIGEESHLMSNILPPLSLLHRAFSCFLFRPTDGKLLLQKRAVEKITFPTTKDEMELTDHIGVRRAAQRKLNHELGIDPRQISISDFIYLTRIHYLAPSDGLWGEHEIDYILFLTAEVDLNVNPNECSDVRWVSPTELKSMIADPSNNFTPWFELIVDKFLFPWWNNLLDRSKGLSVNAHLIADAKDNLIHRMS